MKVQSVNVHAATVAHQASRAELHNLTSPKHHTQGGRSLFEPGDPEGLLIAHLLSPILLTRLAEQQQASSNGRPKAFARAICAECGKQSLADFHRAGAKATVRM